MADYLFLMHDDAPKSMGAQPELDWGPYLTRLRKTGQFEGGSAIGAGACVNKVRDPPGITRQLSGYIRVRADNLDEVKLLLEGNPVFEVGGTVEIRELPLER